MTAPGPGSRQSPPPPTCAPFAVGVVLGASLAAAIILLVLAGMLWPLLAVVVLGGALALWVARSASRTVPRAARAQVSGRPAASFTDWNAEGLVGGAGTRLPAPAAPPLAAATPPARSTSVDPQG